MCGIVGISVGFNALEVYPILYANGERGRDAFGFALPEESNRFPGMSIQDYPSFDQLQLRPDQWLLFNARAEPTTQRLKGPMTEDDTQPYQCGDWVVVHNGIISNDDALIKEYGLKPTTSIDSWVIAGLLNNFDNGDSGYLLEIAFNSMLAVIKGSFAIIAVHRPSGRMFYACNYRPIYKAFKGGRCIISSVKYDGDYSLVEPYSYGEYSYGIFKSNTLYKPIESKRALVVCSGGLDSTVVAAMLIEKGYEVELLHFIYGCRATQNEIKAIKDIATHYGIKARFVETDIFTKVIGNSRLLDPDAEFAEEVEGAETAHEWVPARNIILSSIAIGVAEAHGFDTIALGGNLEESGGGYTDNTFELWVGLNALMPYAIGVGKQVKFIVPLEKMMKRDIAAEALSLNVPVELTWSCYNQGNRHCGHCGPCFMRKTAFEMNGAVDPVFVCE